MVRLSIVLEGIFDTTHELREPQLRAAGDDALKLRQKELEDIHDQGFTFMLATADLDWNCSGTLSPLWVTALADLATLPAEVNPQATTPSRQRPLEYRLIAIRFGMTMSLAKLCVRV